MKRESHRNSVMIAPREAPSSSSKINRAGLTRPTAIVRLRCIAIRSSRSTSWTGQPFVDIFEP